ncbi:hypothetical protein AGMMS49928_18330 [Spirochaetia bacterium]|nr:hypothetical protein AGMMS49928_18330 [Spirochaetia bacterium]
MSKKTKNTTDDEIPDLQDLSPLSGNDDDFLSSQKVIENHDLLEEIGVFKRIDTLKQELRNSRRLLVGALDIFNRTSIDAITDATVSQITDRFTPAFLLFLWKPLQSRREISIRGYKDYNQVDLGVSIDSFDAFEDFFRQYPKPINFDLLAFEIEDKAALAVFDLARPELVIPILGPSGLYGLILVGSKQREAGYDQDELLFMQQLMSFVSQAIQNHLHYQQSLRDVKTGLFNHGYFITRVADEVARSKRGNYASALIVMDVDKFKNFNDNYGHLAGDRVLEHLALTLKQEVRTDDVPSRFGGEEFTVLLPNTGRDSAWVVAERIRTAIAAMVVPWEKPLPQVTISIGAAVFDKDAALNPEEIIQRADSALYVSKEQGRNRTTIWSPEMKKCTE